MKTCTICKEEKELGQFYISRQGVKGPIYFPRCKKCCKTYYNNRWHSLTIEQKRDVKARSTVTPEWHKDYRLRTKYGITLEQFNEAYQQQEGKCYICKNPTAEDQIRVDHCHETKRVRKLLCHKCNILIAFAKEDEMILNAAIEYLREHNCHYTSTQSAGATF